MSDLRCTSGISLKSKLSLFFKVTAAGALAIGALFATATANAQVNWSVGIDAPGVSISGIEEGSVYYEPAPVYSRVAPPRGYSYYQPAPPAYYRPPVPVYVRPETVYYGPPAQPYYEPGDRWRHRHHHRRNWEDRGDRD